MNKHLFYIPLIALAAICLIALPACDDDDNNSNTQQETFSITPDSLSFPKMGGTLALTINSATEPTLLAQNPWLKTTLASSEGSSYTFNVTAEAYTTGTANRTSSITVLAGENSAEVAINQNYTMSQSFDVDATGGTVAPDVQTTTETTITIDAPVDIYIDGERMGSRTWSGPLKAGTYSVECRQDKHRTSTRQITVRQGVSETFTIDPPKPITGMLFVNTAPVGATVTLDGRQGTTPFDDQQLLIGQHVLLLTMKGYEQVSQTIDIDDGAVEQLDITMKQVVSPKMLKEIEKREKEKRAGLEKARRDSLKTYTPQPSRQKSVGGSVMAGLQAGTFMGLDLGAALHLGSIAVEAAYTLGFSKSDAVYWNYDTDTTPEEAVYKPSAISLRLGYAISMGSISLTPQVGARLLMVSSESGNSKCSATSATIGLRADYRLAKAVSLFAAPELSFAISKSSIYEQVADVASDVKGWGTGFNARIGISINF
mgnify:CR=1 FL=1